MSGVSVCGGLDFWGASVCRELMFPGGYCSWGASVSEPAQRGSAKSPLAPSVLDLYDLDYLFT